MNMYEESPEDRIGTMISALDGVAAAMLAGSEAGKTYYFLPHDLEGFYTLLNLIKMELAEIAGELRQAAKAEA